MKKMKKNRKYELYDILEITWIDSHSGGEGWKLPSEVDDWIKRAKNEFTVKTVGYFFHEDEDFIRLCQSYDGQSKNLYGPGKDNLDGLSGIAKSCIKEIRVIKGKKRNIK